MVDGWLRVGAGRGRGIIIVVSVHGGVVGTRLEERAQVGEQTSGFKDFLEQEESSNEEDDLANQEQLGEDEGDGGSHVGSDSSKDLEKNFLRFCLDGVVTVVQFVGDRSNGFAHWKMKNIVVLDAKI